MYGGSSNRQSNNRTKDKGQRGACQPFSCRQYRFALSTMRDVQSWKNCCIPSECHVMLVVFHAESNRVDEGRKKNSTQISISTKVSWIDKRFRFRCVSPFPLKRLQSRTSTGHYFPKSMGMAGGELLRSSHKTPSIIIFSA